MTWNARSKPSAMRSWILNSALSADVATLRQRPFLVGGSPLFLLFCDQKRSRKVPLLPRRPLGGAQRAPPSRKAGPLVRYAQSPAQGARPQGTPKRRSKKQKAKTCRSAARFLTLFASSPIDPSGAKINSTRVGLMAPLEGSSRRQAGEGWPQEYKTYPQPPLSHLRCHRLRGRAPLSLRDISPHCGESPLKGSL